MKLYFEAYDYSEDRNNDGYRNFLDLAKRYFTDEKLRNTISNSDISYSGYISDCWNRGDIDGVLEGLFYRYEDTHDYLSDEHMNYAKQAMKDCLSGKYEWVNINN